MALRKLTKRNYLGEGYIHTFQNNKTGKVIFVPTTEEQYKSMGIKDGYKNNPEKRGYTWISSAGGTIKVDTDNTLLGEDEYTVIGTEAIIFLAGLDRREQVKRVNKNTIINDEIDESVWR